MGFNVAADTPPWIVFINIRKHATMFIFPFSSTIAEGDNIFREGVANCIQVKYLLISVLINKLTPLFNSNKVLNKFITTLNVSVEASHGRVQINHSRYSVAPITGPRQGGSGQNFTTYGFNFGVGFTLGHRLDHIMDLFICFFAWILIKFFSQVKSKCMIPILMTFTFYTGNLILSVSILVFHSAILVLNTLQYGESAKQVWTFDNMK